MSDHMLTPEDMEQLRPAWAELCRLMRTAAESSRAREVVRKGIHTLDDLAGLAEAAPADLAAGLITAEAGRSALAFVERVICRSRHRLDPLVGAELLREVGDDLQDPPAS